MIRLSVVAAPRTGVSIVQQWCTTLFAAGLVLTLLGCDSPGSSTPAPTSPSDPAPAPGPSVPPPSPQPGRYTVNGVVRDSRGAAVAGAEIWIYDFDSPIDNRYGTGFTDAAGRYSVSSPERMPHSVRAAKDGYVTRYVRIDQPAGSGPAWTTDVTMPHIDHYQLLLPTTVIAGGDWARLSARIDLDDGTSQTGLLYMSLSSSDTTILNVEPTGWIRGLRPGAATVTARYYGAATTLQVSVK
jgi:hypothetical protein